MGRNGGVGDSKATFIHFLLGGIHITLNEATCSNQNLICSRLTEIVLVVRSYCIFHFVKLN